MGNFLLVVILIICVLLGVVILIQNPKGGGLAMGFQGASQMGGVQKTTDFLVKATWYLTAALFALCIAAGIQYGSEQDNVPEISNSSQSSSQTAPVGAAEGTDLPSMGDAGGSAELGSEPASELDSEPAAAE